VGNGVSSGADVTGAGK